MSPATYGDAAAQAVVERGPISARLQATIIRSLRIGSPPTPKLMDELHSLLTPTEYDALVCALWRMERARD